MSTPLIPFTEIKSPSLSDPILKSVSECLKSSWSNCLVSQNFLHFKVHNLLTVSEGCLFLGNKIVISKSLWMKVLTMLHHSHAGIVRSNELARSYVAKHG